MTELYDLQSSMEQVDTLWDTIVTSELSFWFKCDKSHTLRFRGQEVMAQYRDILSMERLGWNPPLGL